MSRERKLFVAWVLLVGAVIGGLAAYGSNCTDCFAVGAKYQSQGE